MIKDIGKNFKYDFPASIVVWLVALPLCLGIASASAGNEHIMSGLISGIVGGIIVTMFSGSKYGVSGPAAGLITIVIGAISDLGFESFLLAVTISGIFQFLMGQFKLGIVGYFIPTSVINGMLASIGITLIEKQIPHALGVDTDAIGDFAFFQADGMNSFTEIFYAYEHVNLGAFLIFCLSIILMLTWESTPFKKFKFFNIFPSSLAVVIMGAVLNSTSSIMGNTFSDMVALDGEHLVSLPSGLFTGNYTELFIFPDFSQITNGKVYWYAAILAIVASVETLLSVEATDKLDPDKNISPTNKELKAQGIGNFIAGMIGGLPVTQVIVRSSANINANAKSRMSAVYHGLLLLISVVLFPSLLNKIPLSALAAILIVLGIRLVKIHRIINTWKHDKEAFVPLIVTILAVQFTDLLTGIGIGFGVAMFFILRQNYELAFITSKGEDRTIISFAQIVSFLNKGGIMQTLQEIPDNSKVVISAKKCHTMSNEIIDLIRDYKNITSLRHNIDLQLIGFDKFGIDDQKGSNFEKKNEDE